jgi:glyceraldehyde 3-phosphate dehydrogenase
MAKIAINGFGRIGRTAFRVWWERFRDTSDVAVINTSGSADVETWAHLLKYDTNYGVWPFSVTAKKIRAAKEATDTDIEIGTIEIDGRSILVTAQRDPAKIPWAKYGVENIIECTGVFLTQEKANLHLVGGAKAVILSAPAKDANIGTIVRGVSAPGQKPANGIVSNASCTTNCVTPVAAVMQQAFGIQKALMTTIHAYTDDQNLTDNSHKDLRRARSAARNIVPTTTGAAKTTGEVIPELKGIFDGLAIRVPVSVGSLTDMVFVTKRPTTVEEVNRVFTEAANSERWRGILAVNTDPIVSQDIVGRSESAIVDLPLTQVMGGDLVKVVAWYDNEWGYCNRLVEVAVAL